MSTYSDNAYEGVRRVVYDFGEDIGKAQAGTQRDVL